MLKPMDENATPWLEACLKGKWNLRGYPEWLTAALPAVPVTYSEQGWKALQREFPQLRGKRGKDVSGVTVPSQKDGNVEKIGLAPLAGMFGAREILAHELAHAMDMSWGHALTEHWHELLKATKLDLGRQVSYRATHDTHEDQAETMAYFLENPAQVLKSSPARYAVMERLWSKPGELAKMLLELRK